MTKQEKFLTKLLSGRSDNNIEFNDLCDLLSKFGFELRVKGDHHIFYKKDIEEIINIQPLNAKVKAYQVKQVRSLVLKYKFGIEDDE